VPPEIARKVAAPRLTPENAAILDRIRATSGTSHLRADLQGEGQGWSLGLRLWSENAAILDRIRATAGTSHLRADLQGEGQGLSQGWGLAGG